jgi:hypothetical protein
VRRRTQAENNFVPANSVCIRVSGHVHWTGQSHLQEITRTEPRLAIGAGWRNRSNMRERPRGSNSAEGECRYAVESTTGAVTIGVASLLPRLSVRGAPLATPWLRFQSPLIEPDMRISRIRLSDKTSCFCPRKVAGADDDGETAKCAYLTPAGMALLATTHSARCRPAGSSKKYNAQVLPSLPHGMHFATPETTRVV